MVLPIRRSICASDPRVLFGNAIMDLVELSPFDADNFVCLILGSSGGWILRLNANGGTRTNLVSEALLNLLISS